MNKLIVGVIAAFSIVMFISSLQGEGEEMAYVLDANGFLQGWRNKDDVVSACYDEGFRHNDVGQLFNDLKEFKSIVTRAANLCAMEQYVTLPLEFGRILTEGAFISTRLVPAYEVLRKGLQSDTLVVVTTSKR